MQLIPAIDLRAGRCVRLLRGDFAAETRYATDPIALLHSYRETGCEWLHVVDLDGARDGSQGNHALIATLATEERVKLQVGGGLRDDAAIAKMFSAGVARAVVGSAAITQVERVRTWLTYFGADRIAIAFDVRQDADGVARVTTHGWQQQSQISLWSAVDLYSASGLKHVLCTDVGRDGALSGPNLDLYREAVKRYPRIHWQASGGIRDSRDLWDLDATGVAAAISGKALLENLIPLEELQSFLPNASSPV